MLDIKNDVRKKTVYKLDLKKPEANVLYYCARLLPSHSADADSDTENISGLTSFDMQGKLRHGTSFSELTLPILNCARVAGGR